MGTGAYSEAALRALGVFGLTTDAVQGRTKARERAATVAARRLHAKLNPGGIALVRGASGSGKSTFLRAIANLLHHRGQEPILPPDLTPLANARVIDLLAATPTDMPVALAHLAAAGLADALIPARRLCELSDGQRARLSISLTMRSASTPASAGLPHTIILDELASTLDDATGRGLCITLRRWVRRSPGVRLIAASPRDHVAAWLEPDITIDLDSSANHGTPASSESTSISPGSIADYRALAHLHYRAAAPATHVRVLVAREPGTPHPIGVLVVSMPTLNGAWRSRAWPGEYSGPLLTRRAAAEKINRDLRCISRLIVDPRFRARGVGAALVRAYLADPLTRRTEAIAAMGAACPVFSRAGMHEWVLDPSTRDARLARAIQAAGLTPWMLVNTDLAAKAIKRSPLLEKSLRTWARAHGPTRSLAGAPTHQVIRTAAVSIVAHPRAYTAESAGG